MGAEVQVAVGVIFDLHGNILIAKRPASAHQGGLWEFPGGKVAAGESVTEALARELQEELAIGVTQTSPLIKIRHDYGDKQVLLDVHRVTAFTGTPIGNEGQPLQWVSIAGLDDYSFPQANRAIIQALRLPDQMLVTGAAEDENDFFQRLERALQGGVRLVQLRVAEANLQPRLVAKARALCRHYGSRLLLNAPAAAFSQMPTDGLHLNRWQLQHHQQRPVAESVLLGASCHNRDEILQARNIGADYVLISPVAATASHPDANPLGFEQFAELAALAGCPAYALGGMQPEHLEKVKQHGGQGIAAIRAWWGS